MAATRGGFPNQFDKTIDEMYNDGMMGVPDEASQYASEDSVKGGTYNSYSEISGLEKTREIGEGEGVDYVVPVEGHSVKRYFTKYGLGYQATMEAIEDELFDNIAGAAKALGKSSAYQWQYSFFDLLNSGDDTHKTADGKYIFDTDHPLLNSTSVLDNLAAVDLSETALQAAAQYFDTMKSNAGYPDPQQFKKLIVSTSDKWMAGKLFKTGSVLNSANNDVLTTNPENGLMDWSYDVCHYLTDLDSWFALSNDPGLMVSWKRRASLTEQGDWETEGKMYKTLMRFSVYANRPNGLYGSYGV